MGNGAAKFKVSFIKACMENSCMKLMNVYEKWDQVKIKKNVVFLTAAVWKDRNAQSLSN